MLIKLLAWRSHSAKLWRTEPHIHANNLEMYQVIYQDYTFYDGIINAEILQQIVVSCGYKDVIQEQAKFGSL